MVKYVVDTNSTHRSDVTLSCKLGNYVFQNGQIVSTNEVSEIEELVKYFPRIFSRIGEIKVETLIQEPIKEIKLEMVMEPNGDITEEITEPEIETQSEEPKKQKGRPKKV